VNLVRKEEVTKHYHYNGAGSEYRRIGDDSGGGGSNRNGAVEPAAGLLLHADTAAHDPALCHQLLLHRAPEVPLRRPALGLRLPPLQVRPRRRAAQPLGGLSVEPQNPRRRRCRPLSFLPRSRHRRRRFFQCLQVLPFFPRRSLFRLLPKRFAGRASFLVQFLIFVAI